MFREADDLADAHRVVDFAYVDKSTTLSYQALMFANLEPT